TIWEAAAARSPQGWSVEIRIPVKSLLYKPGLAAWGFNVQRRVQRKLETQRWAYPSRDWRITQMSRAGLLVDLPGFSLDRGLSVRPALVTASGIAAPGAPLSSAVTGSLDATQRLGANTLAFLTVHTDFAETEVDQRRTNPTRFSLFFPEKRWFFLEGTDIFDFGPGIWLAGTDVSLQSSHVFGDKNAQLGLWGLTMDGRNVVGAKTAAGVSLIYPNDTWNNFLGYRWVGDGFQPALGFVPRPGVQQWNLALNYSPRATGPWLARWLSRATFELIAVLVTDLNGRWQTVWGRLAPLNLSFANGDRFAIAAHPEAERLEVPFGIAPGDTIPVGSYTFLRYRIDYVRAEKRRVSWVFTYLGGGFYNGRIGEYIGTVLLKPSPLVIVELSGERDQGTVVPATVPVPFVLERYGVRLRLSASPDLELNTFTQYDNSSRQLGTDIRIRWTFRPSGDLFLTYNHNVDVPPGGRQWTFDSNRLSAKMQYAFRY